MHVLARPRWIAMFTLAAVLVATFISLGLWQRSRLTERRVDNALIAERLAAPPTPIDAVFAALAATLDVEAFEHTRVVASGTFVAAEAVMVRNETNRGEAGFHLVAPLSVAEQAVLVNLGWVPLTMSLDDAVGLVPAGSVTVEGLLRPTEVRPAFGREEPDGVLTVVNRIDIDRLQFQVVEPLLPFWLELTGRGDPPVLPVPVPVPLLDDGPHLSYMVQWFSFAAIALVGIITLARRDVRSARRAERGDHAGVG